MQFVEASVTTTAQLFTGKWFMHSLSISPYGSVTQLLAPLASIPPYLLRFTACRSLEALCCVRGWVPKSSCVYALDAQPRLPCVRLDSPDLFAFAASHPSHPSLNESDKLTQVGARDVYLGLGWELGGAISWLVLLWRHFHLVIEKGCGLLVLRCFHRLIAHSHWLRKDNEMPVHSPRREHPF